MLSRYQYKENYTNTTLSVKKLNRFTKKIKDKLSELEKNNAITISETVDIINDELMGAELCIFHLSSASFPEIQSTQIRYFRAGISAL